MPGLKLRSYIGRFLKEIPNRFYTGCKEVVSNGSFAFVSLSLMLSWNFTSEFYWSVCSDGRTPIK